MNLEDVGISSVLPDFMKAQEDDVAMANALSEVLRKRALRCSQIGIWDSVQTMDDAMLDYVADALHIQWWKRDWDVATKREMLGQSERIRAGINTKAVLEFLLRKWFGDDTLIVEEWFDYGGQPYTYRIVTSNAEVQSLLRFSRIMETVARRSQMMDGIFVGFSMRGPLHIGAKGSESRTDYGTCIQYPYMPKGTRFTHPDALEELLWESGGTGTDMARDLIADATDVGGVLKRDLPLIYAGDDTDEVLGVSSNNRSMWNSAYASQWNAVGADIDEPSMSLVWPIPSKSDLASGCIGYWSFGEDPISAGVSFVNAVDGTEGVPTGVSPAVATSGLIGTGVAGVRATSGTRTDCRVRLLQMPETDNWTVSRWGLKDSGFYRPTLFSTATDMKSGVKATWGRYDNSNFNVTFDSTYRFQGVLPADGWHHVVLTREGAMTSLYINGVLQSQREMDASFAIGGRYFGIDFLAGGYNQVLDEVGIWNRALSADEVATLYHNGLDGVTYPFG